MVRFEVKWRLWARALMWLIDHAPWAVRWVGYGRLFDLVSRGIYSQAVQ